MRILNQTVFILSILILISGSAYAQKRHLKKADAAFQTGEYYKASELYEKAYDKTSGRSEKADIAFRIGQCYKRIDDMSSARRWFRIAVRGNHKNPLSVLYYAQVSLINEDYEDAKEQFQNYADLVPDDPRGKNGLRSVELIQEWKEKPSRYIVEEVQELSSRDDDFSPAFGKLKSELYFTSNRESATGDNTSEITGMPFNDIFEAQRDRKGKWSEPVPVKGNINTPGSEGTPFLVNDGATMYFTHCPQEEGANLGCKTYVSRRGASGWSQPKQLEIVSDSSISVAHPTVSKDELTLYFVSDNLPEGKGGKDIWVTQRASISGKWRKPVNLGSSVNTPGDEMFPFLRDDGVLFFASDGHPGMGGLDIYKAEKEGSGWKITNMKPPINSVANDFSICFYEDEEEGFFSSARSRREDLYSFKLPPLVFALKGKVVNSSNDLPLNDAEVTLQGSDGRELKLKTTDDGSFRFNLNAGTDYAVIGYKEHFLKAKRNVSTKGHDESKTFEVLIDLPPIKSSIELPNIEYDLAKTRLRPESKVALDKLVETLNVNDNITIELMANTDFRGSDEYNLRLSQGRANSVIEYLISKGIKEDRLEAQGYGESNPKKVDSKLARQYPFLDEGDVLDEEFINNLEDEDHKETCHQLNRRTEFRVLSTDYGLETIKFGEEE
jgi:peptidoglycan-associated lipoprotein